jgi:hypothetical protein
LRRQLQSLPVELHWDFEVEPGSLPSLRFGHSYRLRARVADVAGGGRALDDLADDEFATTLVTYRRYEPVGAPLATVDTVVLRSDRGLSAVEFTARNPRYPLPADQALAPPEVSLTMAERHGALDTSDGGAALVDRALREGSLPDPAAQGVVLFVRDEPGAVGSGSSVDKSWSGTWPDLVPKSLRLVEAAPGTPTLTWEGEVGVVRLPPGGYLTLEVSSLMEPNHVDQFEISQWLANLPGSVISGGRHPMATPARTVAFVHAVRKPLTDPAGSLTARRGEHETGALLVPSAPLLGIDPSSTVQVHLSAAWDEWGDHERPVPTSQVLPPVTVPRTATALPDLRHEFGDTKHRRLTYTATAVSRFRQFFDEDEADEAFLAETTLPDVVSVPSSAPPPRPVVRTVTPCVRWGNLDVPAGWTRLDRVRQGGMLRVELDHPWYATGEGEQLAVLAFAGPHLPPVRELVTRAGRDPIWVTEPVPVVPRPDAFAGDSGARFATGDLIAMPYDVWSADGRWYADIEAPGVAAASYRPFLRLVVARYQANSLDGLRLSTPVAVEPVQLLPDRTLTLRREAGTVIAQLDGIGPAGGTPNRVEVVIERADAPGARFSRLAGADEVPGWSAVARGSGTLGAPIAVALPAGGAAQRVVVREVEPLSGDEAAPADHPELTQRTVFADTVPLS